MKMQCLAKGGPKTATKYYATDFYAKPVVAPRDKRSP